MTVETAKFLKNHFTARELEIIAESLDAYDRYVGGTKQKRFEADKLSRLFKLARKD